ncbi:hypothetical protein STVA_37130 [Allostella vacuolata]|nr:hypothetical protein STVA_37130 [Stella vacuolata]
MPRPAPRIHLYTLCWNEAVILPHLFRHYGFVERFVVYDNGSTDASRDLIAAEPKAELREFDTGGRIDERAYVRLKNEAWKESRGSADFVIVCDADEFLYHPQMDRLLLRMRQTGGTILRPAGYEMVGERPPGPDEDLLKLVHSGRRWYEYDKCLLFDPNAIAEMQYGVGGHTCQPTGRVQFFGRPGLALLHYRLLGIAHVRRRFAAVGARLSQYNLDLGLGMGYLESEAATAERFRWFASAAERVVAGPGGGAALEEDEPPDLDQVRAAALEAQRTGNWPAARDGLARVLAYRPGDVDALGNLATVLRRLGLDAEAGWCFKQALALDAGRFEIWFNYGNFCQARGARDAAGNCFQTVVQLRPDFAPGWVNLGNVRQAAGDADGAEEAWRSALQRSPRQVSALRMLGRHLAAAGRLGEAEPVLRAWAEAAPADGEARDAHAAALRGVALRTAAGQAS